MPAADEANESLSRNLERMMHEICPYRIGSRVRIAPASKYASEWPGDYAVVGITWEYQKGDGHGINIAIAHDHDIAGRYGSTDGWRIDDLLPARAALTDSIEGK